ncbi:MAG: immunoglobulin domain-containing protein, partial [Stellaceae bacterium]
TENNSVSSHPGKQTTSLINALFYADSVANVLQTEFNSLIWWDVRNGPDFGENNSASLYGWRRYGDYGVLTSPAAGGPSDYYTGYPAYYALKLLSYFARGGDQIVPVTSSSNFISGYAAKRADGTLALLVINKSPGVTTSVNFTINGYTPAADATVYSYGMPQDTAAENTSGSTDIAQTSLSGVGASFTTSFDPYSISVIALAPAGSIAPAFTVPPQNTAALTGGSVTLTAAAAGNPAPTFQWQRNGADLTGDTDAALVLSDVQPADAGLYNVIVTNSAGSSTSADAILGMATSAKVVGDGSVVATNIRHPNGNLYDQVLLTGGGAAITADAGKVTRTSYIDDNDD